MDELIPEDHLLRKIDSVIDFTKIYEIVSDLYCEKQRKTEYRPHSVVQNGIDTAYLWDTFSA